MLQKILGRSPAFRLGLAALEATDGVDAFLTVACTACAGAHFVDVRMEKVLGDEAPRKDRD